MKQLLLLILFFGFRLHAQWVQIPCPTSVNLNSLHFANKQIGYAGGNGVIVKTIDGGSTWTVLTTNCGTVNSLHCSNKDTVFIMGNYSEGEVTLNGGSTWTSIPNQYGYFSHIYSIHPNFIYCLGIAQLVNVDKPYWASIYNRSNNFTTSWINGYSGSVGEFKSLIFLDTLTGFSCTHNLDGYMTTIPGCIAKTTNGGNTWGRVYGSGINWNCVYFTDHNTGYAVGDDGKICKTTNGGTTWNLQYTGITNDLISVHFANSMTGCAVGSGGMILGTLDGGNNWYVQNSPTSSYLKGVFMTDSLHGIIIGENGTLLKNEKGPVDPNSIPPIAIFPNPFESTLNINLEELESDAYELINMMGTTILSFNLPLKLNKVDLSFLPDGLYFLKVPGEKGTIKKLIKAKN